MTIQSIIDGILKREGGYSNDSDDPGGATMHGITEEVARANGYYGEMARLPESFARAVYVKRYVETPRFDDVADIDEEIAEELIDTGVNMGPARAAEFLQRWLNALNDGGKLFVDGRVGPVTLDALRAFLRRRGAEGRVVLLRALNSSQAVRYLELAEARESNKKFLYGWILQRVR